MADSRFFLFFAKLFFIYIFLENVLLKVSQASIYQLGIKSLGDALIAFFCIYTLLKLKRFELYKKQKILLVILFCTVAILSTIKNSLPMTDLVLGLRSLFRFYLLFFFSFYYTLSVKDFQRLARFLVLTFYVELPIFLVGYFAFGTTSVLYHNYLATAVYLNLIFILVLFERKLSAHNMILLLLIAIQAYLSTSRLAFLGLILQVAVFSFMAPAQGRMKKIIVSAAVFLIIMVIGSYFYTIIPKEGIVSKLSSTSLDSDDNFRMYLLTHFTRLSFEERNLIGDGPNTYGSWRTNPDYHFALGFDQRTIKYSADSHYTILLMSYGFIGLIIFYYLLFSLYRGSSGLKRLLLPFMAFIGFASFTIPVFSMRISSFSIFLLLSFSNMVGNKHD